MDLITHTFLNEIHKSIQVISELNYGNKILYDDNNCKVSSKDGVNKNKTRSENFTSIFIEAMKFKTLKNSTIFLRSQFLRRKNGGFYAERR